MGENEELGEPGGLLPNGLLPGTGPIMGALGTERWMQAEERTAELIACIQPNHMSEERRNAVADYMQRLIMKCFPCQVCTFGSVPLKTYLPDGDIDLTAFSHDQILKDTWANLVKDMLENEEKNENAEFHVKEVQYIQAEVKIIKCLVENIVVDISFNQVGGLCTLCFLDEVDNLISQNHLFKRSVILIKAWCYYESRILGAHHGLISTYALETLVLYIFHLFNNSFHGPLEVLYRFLEFFSNFDWDNFCVSLWGPVPISSLPDVTAESPRKDGGELLLSQLFLDACSSVYAVFPGGQENSSQPFVSKHFNVVDPLRVNNNLGRSVSKGNSFRIRSAFVFGAKRLARLLECPKENLVSEVNQFFLNTWERHGSGHRPDAPRVNSRKFSTPYRSEISKSNLVVKRVNENFSFHEMEVDDNRSHCVSHEHGKISSRLMPERSELSAAYHAQSLKSQFNLNSLRDTNQIGRYQVPDNQVQKDLKMDHLTNDIHGRFLLARTCSSPELTDKYSDILSQRNRQAETANSDTPSIGLDSGKQRKNFGSESLIKPTIRSSIEDTPPMRLLQAEQSLDAAASINSSNNYQRDFGLDSLTEDFSSTSAAHVPQREDQDIVNMMTSASLQGFNSQVHIPFNLTSAHLPFQFPPSFLASMGYTQQNQPRFFPANIPFIDPSFANMQFPHGLVSSQMTRFPGSGINSPPEDSGSTENFGAVELSSREIDHEVLDEQDVASSSDNGKKVIILQPDIKPPEVSSNLKYIPPFRTSGTGSATRAQRKHIRKTYEPLPGNIDSYHNQDVGSGEVYVEERSVSSRFSSEAHNNSLRSRTSSESSWDGSSVKTPKSSKEMRGTKNFSTDLATKHGKGKILTNQVSNETINDDREWGTMLTVEADTVERNLGSERVASSQIPRHHLSGIEVAQTSGSDSMMPFAPMLIGHGSRQGLNDNSGLITFYPAGPPIPFLTMLPIYNVPSEMGASDASTVNIGGDESLDQSESRVKYSSEGLDQSEVRESNIIETFEERKSDILSSDFFSHWQNLQFGRLCQNPSYGGPLVHPTPVTVPPVYLPGQYPCDNPGRPLSTNTNIFSQLMSTSGQHLVPVAPAQSVSSRPLHVRYMDDMPRYRTGTGTYLPNPKISVRERHSSGFRRGNYNHDRNDNYSDRESYLNANSKSRNMGRSHNRGQTDRSHSRTGRLPPSENRADHPRNSYRHESSPSYQIQDGPLHSSSSQNGPQNFAHMYPLAARNPNGVSNEPVSSVVMLYPFDHNPTYGSHGEMLEFGSLGRVAYPGINEQSHLNEGSGVSTFEHNRLHGRSERRSSPNQPSSPDHHRRA